MKNNRLISTINIIPLKLRIYRILRSILIWFLFAGTVNLILSYTLHTPKSYNINKENISLVNKIDDLNDKVDELNDYTENISFRYNNVYKALFGLSDNLDSEHIYEISDNKYSNIYKDRYHQVIYNTYKHSDAIGQKLSSLSVSLDSINSLVNQKGLISKSIPTLSPIHKDDINYISDRFGRRFHPILHKWQEHKGLDMSCSRNTPVYASANGVVTKAIYSAGYGRLIVIDHGFGYVTKYAHLEKYLVKKGQVVTRGEEIALSGNSGRSTGPHLHYEVLFNKKNINPINFISRTMTDKEFAKIVESARTDTTKSTITDYYVQ